MPAENFETRLDSLELQGVEQRNRLIHVERSVETMAKQVTDVSSKLDTLVQAVTTVTAQPRFDIFKTLPALAALVVVVGGLGTIITYIATSVNAAYNIEKSVRAELRIEFLQQRLDNGWFRAGELSRVRVNANPQGQTTTQ